MAKDKTCAIRKLVPKSYHFDGYNELNCPNSRDKPFFGENIIPMGNWHLTIHCQDSQTIGLHFSSICNTGKISFEPYILKLEDFVSKLKNAVRTNSDFITFTITPRYTHTASYCRNCHSENNDCIQFRKESPRKVMAAVSFNIAEVQEALASYYEINTNSGGNTMKTTKKLFGGILNFELGPSKDPSIKSTMMGVSVRNPNNGNWYVFDQSSGTRKNMAGMKFGDFPVILLPTKVLHVGDMIKLDNKYHYVQEVGSGKTIKIIGAADGEVREVYPEESFIPGLNMYTKVMAFDIKTLTDPVSKENLGNNILAAICMMQWANGNNSAEFSLDNINDDSFNGLGAFLPMLLASKDGNLGSMFTNPDGTPNLMMMFMLGNDNGNSNSNQMMQMFLMTQLLGGTNPFAALTQTAPTSTAAPTNVKVICEKCNAVYEEPDVAFCTKCGGKTHVISPSNTNCKKCGTKLRENAAFCHICGTKVAPDVCPSCGKAYEDGDSFCSKCGNPLKQPALKPAGDLTSPDNNTATTTP